MELTELRVDRLKRELGKLELPPTGTKKELQRRLRDQLQLQGIDIECYELWKNEDVEERELQVHATNGGVDVNSLLSATMEKMQVANQMLFAEVQEASRAESQKIKVTNEKLLTETRRESEQMLEKMGVASQKLLANVQEASRTENQKLFEASRAKN